MVILVPPAAGLGLSTSLATGLPAAELLAAGLALAETLAGALGAAEGLLGAPPQAASRSIKGPTGVSHLMARILHARSDSLTPALSRCGGRGSQNQGSTVAWITPGTPLPPTELMAVWTSCRPKRWVHISSSGNLPEPMQRSASSTEL